MEFAETLSQNLKKFVKSLQNRKDREQTNMFIVEGYKLCHELLTSKHPVEFIVITGNADVNIINLANQFFTNGIRIYKARPQQFVQLCDTKSPQGILAVAKINTQQIDYDKPCIILDSVNDPGNLGTIIRTADWFGFKHIILCGESVDNYNAKAVRASMGSLFRCNVTHIDDINSYINEFYTNTKLYGATLTAKKNIHAIKPETNFGLVFGSEAHGISQPFKNQLYEEFLIPGKGSAESLNVAVSAGIACYHFSSFLK